MVSALLQSGPDGTAWLRFAVSLLFPGAVALVLWSPFLLAERLRRLFERLPPTDSAAVSYVLIGMGASVPYVVGVLGAFAAADTGRVLFTATLAVSVGYVVAAPIVAAVALPRVGIDWDPAGYGVSTYVLLLGGALWYVLVFAVSLTTVSAVYSLP